MALINWNNSLSVNVAEIDEQHKKLIGMINDLNNAMRSGKGKEVLGSIIGKMNSYTATHFKLEEDYFAKYGYPELAGHRQQHALFIMKSNEMKAEFESGKLALSVEVMDFLSKWWKDHILVTDKKYSAFFNEKGVK